MEGIWICVLNSHSTNISVVNFNTQAKLYNLVGQQPAITKMVAYEKRFCISSSEDGSVYVWDVLNRASVVTMNHHKAPITDMVLVGHHLITVG